jgi:hypothetical protein
MSHPGSQIRIPKFLIPDPGSQIRISKVFIPDPTVHKKGMKNKSNLFIAPYGFRRKAY